MNLSIAIQTHPHRVTMAAALAYRIGGAEVVQDPDPLGGRSAWRCYRRCLELTPADATHRLIVQDDTKVCNQFVEAATNAVRARPGRLILFYVGGSPVRYASAVLDACRRDEVWAELDGRHWCPVVATCWPVHLIPLMLGYADEQGWVNRYPADDEIVGRFLRSIDECPVATVPSLVEHPDHVKSLVGMRASHGEDPSRVAACWIGDCDECDPSEIDWS